MTGLGKLRKPCLMTWENVAIGKPFDAAQGSNPNEKRVERSRNPTPQLHDEKRVERSRNPTP